MKRLRRVLARTPLRVRLVAAVLLLVVVALVGSGIAATATLRSYLVSRVDSQLTAARSSIAEHQAGLASGGRQRDSGGRGGRGDGGPGTNVLPSAYVTEVTNADGTVVVPTNSDNLLDPGEPLPDLSDTRLGQLDGRASRIVTVGAVRGDEKWRVSASRVSLASGASGTLLVALSLRDVANTANRLTLLLLVIDVVAVVLLAGAGYLVVRRSLRPLREVERTATDIAAGMLSQRVPAADPRTEVGQLAGALNTMLDRLENAFAERAASEDAARRSEERMRRFVADASHELRTPLTTIRGFAELYRQGATSSPADVERSMTRIEDEARRMGLLVEDLLMLARLDRERPLARAPVDLLALASSAVRDTQALATDRPIRLEVGPSDPPPIVIGDETRLRQVLANLLGNAVKHTPAGTAVTVRVETSAAGTDGPVTAILSVCDTGPGLAAEDAARVFERFYRADRARSRAEGSTGLGLAIVAALVAGHHGTVAVRTAPGEGACFVVELPATSAAPGAAPGP